MGRKDIRALLDRYRITSGKGFRLKDHDPADTAERLVDKDEAEALLADGVARLSRLQELLYPHASWAVLCIFQAMDAAGKDSTIKHVMSGVNPQGVQVTSFKTPGPEELAHDFLWRIVGKLPERGYIGIFNRSHYEEVLVVRVHPEILEKQRLPAALNGKKIWKHRLEDIAAFEQHLARQGTVVLKFFLNVSKAEQKRRFFERLEDPGKNWKFSASDIAERQHWDAYMKAYEDAITATAAEHAPWYVVPADNKWFTRLVVMEAIIAAIEALDLKAKEMPAPDRIRLAEARQLLEAEES
ncbi:Polyphosphate:ADP phosphotransferase [Rhodovastum atsumiense]|uniref:Polyphosphate kinase 2 family protein n=1 Tax=Rhodovastum atsumiense TaxID=504468 RepID=A0A5M6IKP1_9PROT|nr:polyphosphate kinase 2 family protein [Rhodovastum atsumiense]KAA5608833.1 polyphosphate kinase 2 family protein [Rhodovastum atsumiense]CAH2599343.1 Polyphosphate:ADP phosphotransferase [Rhodovastum atsumiense]